MTVPLDWKVLVLSPNKMPFTLSVSAETKHRIAVNLVCGRSRSVSFQFTIFWSQSSRSDESLLQSEDVSQASTELAAPRFLKLPQRAGEATEV